MKKKPQPQPPETKQPQPTKTNQYYLDLTSMAFPRLPGITNTVSRVLQGRSIDVFKIGLLTKIHICFFGHDATRKDTLSLQKNVIHFTTFPKIHFLMLLWTPQHTNTCSKNTREQTKCHKPPEFLNRGPLLPALEKNESCSVWHASVLF